MCALGPDEATQAMVRAAADALRRGGVVALPTDTLYGLAACAFDEAAVQRVFELKGRPDGMALPVLLADPGDAARCAVDVPNVAWRLVERFWPGALTLVLRKAPVIPDAVSGGKDTVALRVPDHWAPRSVARELGAPITGTSANRTGSPGLTSAEAVRAEFGDSLDFVLDGGEPPGGLASTVLDLTGARPTILRQGAVTVDAIAQVCEQVLTT